MRRKVEIEKPQCHTEVERKREVIMAYEVDGMRKLIVPDRNPIDIPGVFTQSELERLKNRAKIVTLKDRMTMLDEAERQKDSLQAESNKRKELLANAQDKNKAKADSKMTDIERETKAKSMYLSKRSHDLIQEQDNRVKAVNRVIMATKCKAIRNAQLAEKELIEKELQEEDRRLDQMMEQARQKALEAEERRKQQEETKKQVYINALSEQMRVNEVSRMMEAEHIEEESKMVNKAFLAVQREQEEKLRQKKLTQQQVWQDLDRANKDQENYKLMQAEERRIGDLRIQKYMQQKLEREMAREQEQAMNKAAKELEIARMRLTQEKAQDHRAAMDEMNALRIQEEVERQWRAKELAAAKKKKEQQELLKCEREKQIDDIRKAAAMELARDEEAFHKVAIVQREEWTKEMEKRRQLREGRELHRQSLLKQINQKERERILTQKEKFEDGKMQRLEQKRKDLDIAEYLQAKLVHLKDIQLPDHYIHEIEGQIVNIIKKI